MKIFTCMTITVLLFPVGAITSRGLEQETDSIKQLRDQISLCNLLNGLYLSEDQMVELRDLAEEVDRYYQSARSERDRLHNDLEDSFSDLRDVVLAGKTIPEDVRRKAMITNHRLKKKVDELRLKIGENAKKAEDIFSRSQKQIIADFSPCLIPPKSLEKPERVGQAESSDIFKKILYRLRKIPPWQFEDAFDRWFQRHIKKIATHYGPLDSSEKENERERLYEIASRARDLSDVEFSLQQDELAREAGEEGLGKGYQGDNEREIRRKIARIFFKAGSSEIYAERLAVIRTNHEN